MSFQHDQQHAFATVNALSPTVLAEIRNEIDLLLETGASFSEAKETLNRLADRNPRAAAQGEAL